MQQRWDPDSDEPAGRERMRRVSDAERRLGLSARWSQCGKKSRYPTEHAAERYGRKSARRTGVGLHAYPCIFCGGWHLARNSRGCG